MNSAKFFAVLVAALLLASGAPAAAQALHGTVVDSTGAPVASARVTVQAGAQSISADTSQDGNFVLAGATPPAQVTVNASGFAPATAEWNGEPAVHVTLKPAPVQQQIVVTATRTSAPLADVAASVSRVPASQIAASPNLQIDDLLRQVPGFSLFRRSDSRTANPTSQGASLRGLGASGASRALVLNDGVPLNDPFGGWVYWDRVPVTELESIEVLRGGASSLYGAGALAGVVDLRSRPVHDRAAVLDFSGGQQGIANGSATVSESIGHWGLSASAQAMRSNGYYLVAPDLRGAVDTPASLRFATGIFRLDRQFQNASVFAAGNLFEESRNNGTVLQINSTRLAEGSAGADLLAGGGALSLRTYLSGQHFHQTFSSIADDRNSERLVRDQIVPAQQFGMSALWDRPLGAINTLVVGADMRRVTGHSLETIWGSTAPIGTADAGGRQLYFGGFLEDMLKLGSRLHLTGAARLDGWRNYDALSTSVSSGKTPVATPFAPRSDVAFSPSLGAVFRVNHLVSLTASGFGAFRSPTLNELYRAFRVGNVLTRANSGLNAERLSGGEAGVNVGSGPLFVRAAYFYETIHNAIGNRTLSVTPALITRQRQNLGDILSRGIEVEAQARLPRNLWMRTAYEYSNSVVSNSLEPALLGLRVPQVPRHAVSQTIGYEGRRWSGNVVGRYLGAQFDDDLNQFALPGYFTADAMLRAHLGDGVEPFIAVENLLDRQYAIGRTPTPTLGSPRLVRAGVRFQWGGDQPK